MDGRTDADADDGSSDNKDISVQLSWGLTDFGNWSPKRFWSTIFLGQQNYFRKGVGG